MFGLQLGRLGIAGLTSVWSPLALWPGGASTPGLWISPRTLASSFADSTGTTPVATPGTVADTSNPVGLALDIRAGATALADPGLHMLQATSTARPLVSARRNLLQYTADFTNGYWVNDTATVTPNYGTAPDGTQTSTRLVFPGPSNAILKGNILAASVPSTSSCWVKGPAGETLHFEASLATGNLVTLTGSWQLAVCEHAAGQSFVIGTYSGATARDIEVWRPQFERGAEATEYQSIPGDGSTYAPATPVAQLYDGVDDGMATDSFSAGTLIDGMDCMIAVRRNNNALPQILGLYQADQTKYFGVASESSPDAGTFSGCGTPTIFVNNVETENTRGELFYAMPFGDFHILEYRGLDLSAWVDANFGKYPTYQFNGARGDILLYPSAASTADKDKARQWLANYYGVTLA